MVGAESLARSRRLAAFGRPHPAGHGRPGEIPMRSMGGSALLDGAGPAVGVKFAGDYGKLSSVGSTCGYCDL